MSYLTKTSPCRVMKHVASLSSGNVYIIFPHEWGSVKRIYLYCFRSILCVSHNLRP